MLNHGQPSIASRLICGEPRRNRFPLSRSKQTLENTFHRLAIVVSRAYPMITRPWKPQLKKISKFSLKPRKAISYQYIYSSSPPVFHVSPSELTSHPEGSSRLRCRTSATFHWQSARPAGRSAPPAVQIPNPWSTKRGRYPRSNNRIRQTESRTERRDWSAHWSSVDCLLRGDSSRQQRSMTSKRCWTAAAFCLRRLRWWLGHFLRVPSLCRWWMAAKRKREAKKSTVSEESFDDLKAYSRSELIAVAH